MRFANSVRTLLQQLQWETLETAALWDVLNRELRLRGLRVVSSLPSVGTFPPARGRLVDSALAAMWDNCSRASRGNSCIMQDRCVLEALWNR